MSTTIPAAVVPTLGRDELDELRWLAGQLVADAYGRIKGGGDFNDMRRFQDYARALGALGMDIDYDWSEDDPAEQLARHLPDFEPLLAGAQEMEAWFRQTAASSSEWAWWDDVADRVAAAHAILVRFLETHGAGR